MCLAIPVRVVDLKPEGMARVEVGGVHKDISLLFVEDVAPGDYVLLHVGYAIQKLDPDEAERTLRLFAEVIGGPQGAGEPPGPGGPRGSGDPGPFPPPATSRCK